MTGEQLPTLDSLIDALEPLVAARSTGLGAVAGVVEDGRVAVGAVGTGLRGPMAADAVIELHCAAKPLVAIAAARTVAAAGWDAGAPVVELVPESAHLEGASVASLIHHGVRLARPAALHWIATPPDRRPGVADLRQLPRGEHAYSEVGAGLVLGEVLGALADEAADAVVDRVLLDPLGIIDDATVSARTIGQRARLEPVFADLPTDPRPMLHPLHPAFVARQCTAFGGYATAAAYLTILGASLDLLEASPALTARRGNALDHVLRRELDLRAGFLLAGPDWCTGLLFSVTSIANVVVAALPRRGWAAFVFLNGLVATSDDAAFTRRMVFPSLLVRR